MNFLKRERDTLEALMPGFDARLREIPLLEMESKGNPGIALFREFGGPALLVSAEYGGKQANQLQMVRLQRAMASRSPSLALATNMHSCTVAAVPPCEATAELLKSIAENGLYLASGFADGQPRKSILRPSMEIERAEGGWLLSGRKKPVSLSESMDFLTASVLLPAKEGGGEELALVTIPADTPGITVLEYGNDQILMGAENNEVVLERVFVGDEYISYFGGPDQLNEALSTAFLWFECFVSSAYLGAASALVERVLQHNRGNETERMALITQTESTMMAIEGVATSIMGGHDEEIDVARALYVRYGTQQAIERITQHAAELLGGVSYLESNEVSTLLSACRALAFHPPSRFSITPALDAFMLGEPLIIP
ncbi:hypothetical protein [Endothiovibrio diazotrophicus]